jgi:hypothetical protein
LLADITLTITVFAQKPILTSFGFSYFITASVIPNPASFTTESLRVVVQILQMVFLRPIETAKIRSLAVSARFVP